MRPKASERFLSVEKFGLSQFLQAETDASRDLVILAKGHCIKELEAENQKLELQFKVALAKAYDQI
jgi:hypothetical protein